MESDGRRWGAQVGIVWLGQEEVRDVSGIYLQVLRITAVYADEMNLLGRQATGVSRGIIEESEPEAKEAPTVRFDAREAGRHWVLVDTRAYFYASAIKAATR